MRKLSIDKTEWKPVKFGDVAYEPKESIKDPLANGIEHVVGLEHIDSEDIHLRKSAGIEKSTTFTKSFSKGDVLFGRRRAYLKKAALANFDGICSGDITVFRAKNNLLPELLPFVVHNEKFFDHAVKHSAGGLSPRVKFKDLANYEFLLPPKDQQAQLAELLWAMDDVIENQYQTKNLVIKTLDSLLWQIFTSHIIESRRKNITVKSLFQTKWEIKPFPIGWAVYELNEVVENTQNGFAEGKRDSEGISQIRMNNITRASRIDLSDVIKVPSKKNIGNYLIKEGDIIFCNTSSYDLIGKTIIADKTISGFTFSNHFTRIRARESLVLPEFLYLWFKFHFDILFFQRLCTRWINQVAVQTDSLLRLKIILPPIKEQEIAIKMAQSLQISTDQLTESIKHSKDLKKSLINQVF